MLNFTTCDPEDKIQMVLSSLFRMLSLNNAEQGAVAYLLAANVEPQEIVLLAKPSGGDALEMNIFQSDKRKE